MSNGRREFLKKLALLPVLPKVAPEWLVRERWWNLKFNILSSLGFYGRGGTVGTAQGDDPDATPWKPPSGHTVQLPYSSKPPPGDPLWRLGDFLPHHRPRGMILFGDPDYMNQGVAR